MADEAAEIAAPHQPYRKSNLTAGRTWQKLAKRDQIGENGFVDPATPDYKFVSEIANVGDWTAEATYAELGESEQNLQGRAGSTALNRLPIHSRRPLASSAYSTSDDNYRYVIKPMKPSSW